MLRFCTVFALTLALSLALSLALYAPATAAEKLVFRAGAFAMDVTPLKFPISVNGNMADKLADKANDPLHARCLVLDDGKTRLALVVVDSCMIPRELLDAAKTRAEKLTGIPAKNILISATHCHSAPTVGGVFQSDPDAGYVAFLTEKIAEGIAKAAANLTPAEVGYGSVQEPSQLFNRRWRMKPGTLNKDPFGGTTDVVKMNPGYQNPGLLEQAGPIDPDVSVLAVRAVGSKRPLALYANYSLHYVGDLPALSADYFGSFCEQVAPLVGADEKEPRFMAALSNGTSGDVNNVDFANPARKSDGPGSRCRLVAGVVASAAKKAWESATFRSDISLSVAEQELTLKVRKPTAAELVRAKGLLEAAANRSLKGVEEIYARETVLIDKYPDTVNLRLQAMRIGGLGITAIPCEVFTEIGLAIKNKSPLKPTLNVSLANGYNGYLPTPEHHQLGGYETWRARSSYLEADASTKITAVILKLLSDVAPK